MTNATRTAYVTGTYNTKDAELGYLAERLSAAGIAILGPCVGDEGYELVDVADQSPWNRLRASQ